MQFNTWGIGRRDEIASTFEPDSFPFIARVKSYLDLEIVEIKGNGEPVQIALGERSNPGDPEAAQVRVTPFFSSFDALDFFCRLNLQHYLAFDPADGLPRRWFWEESQRRRQTVTPTPALTANADKRVVSASGGGYCGIGPTGNQVCSTARGLRLSLDIQKQDH